MSRVPELSDTIFDALNEALPNNDDDSQVIWRVDVSDGWASILFVTVCSGIRRHDAGAALAEKIHAVVARVMDGRGHVVRIIWAI